MNFLQGEYANFGPQISIRFFCSIVPEEYLSKGIGSKSQPFSRKIDSKFIELLIYHFVSTVFEKHVVAQRLKCLTTMLETRVRFPLFFL